MLSQQQCCHHDPTSPEPRATMGRLILRLVEVPEQYADHGSSAKIDLACGSRPTTAPVHGEYVLDRYFGQTPRTGFGNVSAWAACTTDAKFVGYGSEWWELIWDTQGTKPKEYSIWRIRESKIPHGYTCVSPCMFTRKDKGIQEPDASDVAGMVLVPNHLTRQVPGSEFREVWNDHGTGSPKDATVLSYGVGGGCFAIPSYDRTAFNAATHPVLDVTQPEVFQIYSYDEVVAALKQSAPKANVLSRFGGFPPAQCPSYFVATTQLWMNEAYNQDSSNWPQCMKECADLTYDQAVNMHSAVSRHVPRDAFLRTVKASPFCGIAVVQEIVSGTLHAVNCCMGSGGVAMLFEPQGGTWLSSCGSAAQYETKCLLVL
eukprot:m51a1_g12087 hypothetical protein (373) ;mRNA; r:126-1544